jgi:hypothetical protein
VNWMAISETESGIAWAIQRHVALLPSQVTIASVRALSWYTNRTRKINSHARTARKNDTRTGRFRLFAMIGACVLITRISLVEDRADRVRIAGNHGPDQLSFHFIG